jgi:hypothetical protein
MSLTLVNPGHNSPLVVKAIPPGTIVVTLAYSAGAVTTTPALLVAALNNSSSVRRWVAAWISDSTIVAPLVALPQTYFAGGQDIPFLVYVSTNASTAGVIATTAAQVTTLLNGSKLVSAANSGTSTGAGAIVAMGPTALTAGTLSAGAILDEDATELENSRLARTLGQGINHRTNYGLQVQIDRTGAERTLRVVPAQDRAIIASSTVNHSMEHGPRSLYL